jgi:hypothetical protein
VIVGEILELAPEGMLPRSDLFFETDMCLCVVLVFLHDLDVQRACDVNTGSCLV